MKKVLSNAFVVYLRLKLLWKDINASCVYILYEIKLGLYTGNPSHHAYQSSVWVLTDFKSLCEMHFATKVDTKQMLNPHDDINSNYNYA